MLDMPREAGDNKESEGTHRHPTLQTLCDCPDCHGQERIFKRVSDLKCHYLKAHPHDPFLTTPSQRGMAFGWPYTQKITSGLFNPQHGQMRWPGRQRQPSCQC